MLYLVYNRLAAGKISTSVRSITFSIKNITYFFSMLLNVNVGLNDFNLH